MATWGRAAQACAGAIMALATPAAAAVPAAQLFYERSVMTAADAACKLFDAPLSAALAAAKAQARGAALRSGADPAALESLEARATAAAAADGCASPDIAAVAGRVRAAFDSYAKLQRLTYPGDLADWTAERAPADGSAHWRVSQRVRFGWDVMVFGLAGKGAGRPLMAVASFADGAEPFAARLVLRDAAVTLGPYLDLRQADIRGRMPLGARLPPRAAARIFAAEAMSPAGHDLRPADLDRAWAFRFPAAAADALGALDPREAVAVEYLFAGDGGEQVRTAYVEVGDFAAARAFQSIAQR